MASSPTVVSGAIWQNFMAARVKKRYFVPCPHCGEMTTLELSGVKWPEELNELPPREREARVAGEAWYECPACRCRIDDMMKYAMLQGGEWRPVTRREDGEWVEDFAAAQRPESVGYNIGSIYSPWLTFGQIAQKFLHAKNDVLSFMNFQNGWLALPWTPKAATMRSDAVMALQQPYEQNVVPRDAQLLTCGVDVQQDCMYYVVRAWGPRLTSWLVDYDRVETWTASSTAPTKSTTATRCSSTSASSIRGTKPPKFTSTARCAPKWPTRPRAAAPRWPARRSSKAPSKSPSSAV